MTFPIDCPSERAARCQTHDQGGRHGLAQLTNRGAAFCPPGASSLLCKLPLQTGRTSRPGGLASDILDLPAGPTPWRLV